jgi:hypothetical protein
MGRYLGQNESLGRHWGDGLTSERQCNQALHDPIYEGSLATSGVVHQTRVVSLFLRQEAFHRRGRREIRTEGKYFEDESKAGDVLFFMDGGDRQLPAQHNGQGS